MEIEKFKAIENQYQDLKQKYNKGEISSDHIKSELKNLKVLDDDGKYWMIGGKTGKWYIYDGSDWKESDPYKEESVETKTSEENNVTIDLNKSETQIESHQEDSTTVHCKVCKSNIPAQTVYCGVCGANQKTFGSAKPAKQAGKEGYLLIKYINIPSFIFFLGGFGLIFGVLFGATFGIFNILGDLIYQFPIMLQETRGKIQGGLIFAAIGGIGGFLLLSVLSVVFSSVFNFISYFFGGVRFKIKN